MSHHPGTVPRSLHDVGLAAWFGGTLANAVALNLASGKASNPAARGQVANTGWDRWTPVNAAAIAAHLARSIAQLNSNKSRLVFDASSTLPHDQAPVRDHFRLPPAR